MSDKETDTENEEDLLGGLDVETSDEIDTPDNLLDQVIGQSDAVEKIRQAAKKKKHILMIGPPGTGKSMLAKAMAEMMPKDRGDYEMQDVLVYPNPEDDKKPKTKTVPAGKGEEIVESEKEEVNKRENMRNILMWLLMAGTIVFAFLKSSLLMGIIAAGIIFIIFSYVIGSESKKLPNLIIDQSDNDSAPFNDATNAHSGALLGDVEHDPLQSGGMGTPAHNRVEAGMIHKSNNGVLFLDEINRLKPQDQQALMTAIQEGEMKITAQSERSSGAMVSTEPVPCDFSLVAAGNRDALENLHPAIRDRLSGYGYEIYMDDKIEDTPENRRKIARFVAQEIEKAESHVPPFDREAMEEIVREARKRANKKESLTLRLRSLGGIIRKAGDIADSEDASIVTQEHVEKAKEKDKTIEAQMTDKFIERKKDYSVSNSTGARVGAVNGLAVMGQNSGILLPLMAEVTEAHGGGEVIATGKLEEIAEESVQNVSAIIKNLTGEDIKEKDVHIQFVQTHEGVDGDSASVTIATAIISSIEGLEVDQSVAMTGSLSVRGDVLPVGGVTHKVEAAAKAGMDKVIIPEMNKDDLVIDDEIEEQIEIKPVSEISEVLDEALVSYGEGRVEEVVNRLKKMTQSPRAKNPVSSIEDKTTTQ